MKLSIACLTFVFLATANAQYYTDGTRCPTVRVQEDLSLDKHQGRWYKAVSTDGPSADQHCWSNYSSAMGDTIIYTSTKVVNKQLENLSSLLMYLGYGTLADFYYRDSKWYILATDYENYSVTYSCGIFGRWHATSISISTRDPNPSAAVIEEAKAKIAAQGLPVEKLTVTRTKACDPFIN